MARPTAIAKNLLFITSNLTPCGMCMPLPGRAKALTEKAIPRGVFKSVPDLIAAIEAYLKPTTTIPSRSYGPPRQRRSSRKSAEAGSHSHQSRLTTRHHTSYRRVPRGRPGTRPGFAGGEV